MTEDKQGGTTPDPEAIAPETHQAPEPTVAAVAVADDPATDPTAAVVDAESTSGSGDTTDTTDADDTAAPEAAVAEPATPEAPAAEEAAAEFDAPPADDAAPAADVPAEPEPEPAADVAADAVDVVDAAAEPAADEAADAPAAVDEPADEPAAEASAPQPADEPAVEAEAAAPEPAPKRDLGPEPTTMEELLAEQDSEIKSFKHGDVVEGNVVRIDKDEILVDIGAKSEGVVSNRELYGRHAESQPQLNIGDTVLVYVLQPESQEGHAVLSLRRAGLERKWRSMQEQFEAGVIIEAPVIDHNKGGLIVDCGIRGFVPISQIVDFPRRPQNDQPRDAAQEIAEKLQPFVGRKLRLKILEVNRKANRLILSEKVALYEERREKRDELFSSLQVGQKVTGSVRSIAPFGVFVDLGGIDGLVHKSELSWNKVNNPEGGYRVGEEVEAEVIDINHERGRISLSIRRLQPDPWHSTVADFKVGDVIDGTVTKLVNFGAFVRVRDGLEGLIHISELSNQRVAHPGDVVHEGQALKLRIISLDSERHRLGLSLKQAEEAPARPVVEPGAPSDGGAPGPRADRPERAERGDRRPRGDRDRPRAYSAADAVQEPEGGIDTTLAAAFAGVREQLARAEAGDDEAAPPAEDESPEATGTASGAEETVEAVAEPVAAAEPEADTAVEPEAVAEVAPEAEAAPVAEPEAAAEPEPEAASEPEAVAAPVAAEPDAEPDAAPEPEAVAEAAAPEAAAEPETAPVTEAEPVAEASAPADDAATADAPDEDEKPAG